MVLDTQDNFVRGATDSSVTAGDTTISVTDASIYPDPSTTTEYNAVIWDSANHPRPDQDSDVEILRVTAIDTTNDNLTVTRGQESTTDVSHPNGAAVQVSTTAKMFSDIDGVFGDFWDAGNSELTADVNNSAVSTDEAQVNDTSQDPTTDGEIRRNGTDIKAYTGGAVKNLSDIGSGGSSGTDKTTAYYHGGLG